jgi:hypothetical protein
MLPISTQARLRMGMFSRVANGFLRNPVETDGHLRTRRPTSDLTSNHTRNSSMPAEFSAVAA